MQKSRFKVVITFALLAACSSGPAVPGSGELPDAGGSAGSGAGGAAGNAGTAPDVDGAAGAGGASGGAAGAGGASGGGAGAGGSTGGAAGAAGSTGGAAGAGGSTGGAAGAGGTTGGAVILNQTGNPIYAQLTSYTSWLSVAADAAAKLTEDKALADNMITWQMPHGGFYKNAKTVYAAPWDGTAARSGWLGENNVELGTIDNDATVIELMFLADVYRRSGDIKYRDSARKALDFLLTMQHAMGGFPQVYPARALTTYSNYVTFNDDAMARVMVLLDQAAKLKPPLDSDLFTTEQRDRLPSSITKGIDYIVKAQMEQNGVKTVWCAQHDPVTYAPKPARSYELASKSGKESANVVALLMTQPQTPEIKAAALAAIAWFKSGAVKVADTAYVKRPAGNTDDTYNPIQASPGTTIWYRFYDLDKDVGFFSGRLPTDNPPGVGKKYNIMEIEAERRYGYEWGGGYGTKLFMYTDSVGY
ncbi:MAG TPA: pectate lyase [Polyangiaceae bacterium]|nr:pectate lyase [Polyangiaceae bacterium]